MITKEGSTKIATFKTPWTGVLALERGHISHLQKTHFPIKNHLLYSQAYVKQTYIVMMTREGTFHDPGSGVLVLCFGHIRHIAKCIYFFENLLLYSQA